MKNLKTALIIICFGLHFLNIYAQNIYIPDSCFKAALLQNKWVNLNGDTAIQIKEATDNDMYRGLKLSNKGIKDLTGIEFFDIVFIDCSLNQLTKLDLSKNTKLTSIDCSSNQLTSINVSNNKALTKLYCHSNQLSNIDLGNNKALSELICRSNLLTSLDLRKNKSLYFISCSENQLSSLNLKNGNNFKIKFFDAHFNPLLKCIEIDNPNRPEDYNQWIKDSSTSFNCK